MHKTCVLTLLHPRMVALAAVALLAVACNPSIRDVAVYHYLSTHGKPGQSSHDVRVAEGPGHEARLFTTGAGSKYCVWTKAIGSACYSNCENCRSAYGGATPDVFDLFLGVGSTNITVEVDPAIGHTTLIRLQFNDSCTIRKIWDDGTVELDRIGIKATDAAGKNWVSRKVSTGIGTAIVMSAP